MSRVLDAQVAEKVMGWTKRVSADHTNSHVKVLRAMGIIYAWKDDKGKERGLDVPPCSTEISAAWLVVERLNERGLWFDIGTTVEASMESIRAAGLDLTKQPRIWGCYIDRKVVARADTAPLAICLAALKALQS